MRATGRKLEKREEKGTRKRGEGSRLKPENTTTDLLALDHTIQLFLFF